MKDEQAERILLGFSGGKDSTACGEILASEGEPFELLFTPTGNELPEVAAHIQAMSERWGAPVIIPKGPQLIPLIRHFGALPNWRQRWCTRMIKIQPCIAYLVANPGATLCVGLRADEEDRQGLYGDFATYRYPLRERGLDLKATSSSWPTPGLRPAADGLPALLRPAPHGVARPLARPPRGVCQGGGAGGSDGAHVPVRRPRHLAGLARRATGGVRGRPSAARSGWVRQGTGGVPCLPPLN